jgi:hypothetical protein
LLFFHFEKLLAEEAELDPVKGEFEKFQIASSDLLDPGRLYLEAIQERALEDEVPEFVDVVESHKHHLVNLGIVNVKVLGAERDRDRGEQVVHFIVRHNALIHEPFADLPCLFFLETLAKGGIGNDAKGHVILHIQRIHPTGPGTILVHRAPVLGNQGTSFVLLVHSEENQRDKPILSRNDDGVFLQELFRGNAEGILEANHIVGGQGDGHICATPGEAGHTGAALKTKDMIGVHRFCGFLLVRTFMNRHVKFLSIPRPSQKVLDGLEPIVFIRGISIQHCGNRVNSNRSSKK